MSLRVVPTMSEATDVELIAALSGGSGAAFDTLYARHSARLMRFLVHLTGQPALAEDLYQEAWLKLARGAGSLNADTQLYAWLITVARNAWISRLRKDRRVSPLDEHDDPVDEMLLPDEHAHAQQLARGLAEALQELTPGDRELLLLVSEGLPHEQVAQIVGASPVALRQRVSRARARLLARLQRQAARAGVTTRATSGLGRALKGAAQ